MSEISMGITLSVTVIKFCHKIYQGLTKLRDKNKSNSVILKMIDVQRFGNAQLFEGFLQESIKDEIFKWRKPKPVNTAWLNIGFNHIIKREKRRDEIAKITVNMVKLDQILKDSIKEYDSLANNKNIKKFVDFFSLKVDEIINQKYEKQINDRIIIGNKKLELYIYGNILA